MRSLFVDMDGTIAEWRNIKYLERLYEEGYFATLKPQYPVIGAVKELVNSGIQVNILSAVLTDSKTALKEKNEWLDRYLPEVEHRYFPPCGVSKLLWLQENGLFITKDSFLLDDYSRNLHQWEAQGTAIKYRNGINGTKGTWKGLSVDKDTVQSIGKIIGG